MWLLLVVGAVFGLVFYKSFIGPSLFPSLYPKGPWWRRKPKVIWRCLDCGGEFKRLKHDCPTPGRHQGDM